MVTRSLQLTSAFALGVVHSVGLDEHRATGSTVAGHTAPFAAENPRRSARPSHPPAESPAPADLRPVLTDLPFPGGRMAGSILSTLAHTLLLLCFLSSFLPGLRPLTLKALDSEDLKHVLA